MKFRFIGDPRHGFDGPDRLVKFDHVFTRVDWTEVKDKAIIAKLLGHSHFESAGAFADAPKPHQDYSVVREAMFKEAEALGVVIDRRWSNVTLITKISEAKAGKSNENAL